MATVLSRGIDDVVASSENGPKPSSAEEKKSKEITRWVVFVFSLSEVSRTWNTTPLHVLLPPFLAFTTPVPSPGHPSTAYTHPGRRAQQDQAPGISEMATGQEITIVRCPRTGGPDESRGRADGTSATFARSPTCASSSGCVKSRNPIPSPCDGGCHRRVRQDST